MDYRIYDTEWLLTKIDSGERIKYIYFWGHQARADGVITQACLSQWWSSTPPFLVEGQKYATAEHWMMVEKARLFGAEDIAAEILTREQPGAAKAFGRKVEGFNQEIWNKEKFDIVVRGNFHKFSQNPKLKTFLKNTGNRVLVEASPIDRVWGIGLAKEDPDCSDPSKWKGQNLLGYALMSVRDML